MENSEKHKRRVSKFFFPDQKKTKEKYSTSSMNPERIRAEGRRANSIILCWKKLNTADPSARRLGGT